MLLVKKTKFNGKIMMIIVLVLSLHPYLCGCQGSQELPKEDTVDLPEKLNIRANNVFFYYKDLTKAQEFYENVMGLKLVLDYGFAKIFQISQTSFVGLVDEAKGMHNADEPKTVTLSFVTEEIDEWYTYLTDQNVEMRGPIGNATRHPTRGFVAYDPEGYFLEFETFLDHPQNEKLLDQLKNSPALYLLEHQVTSRPKSLGVQASIFWLYYKDLVEAQKFYNEVLNLEVILDQGFTKVYQASETAFIGLVDEAQGLHRYSEEKAVTVCFFTDHIKQWFEYLNEMDLKMRTPSILLENEIVEVFVTYDVGGYFLEFDHFLDDELNADLLRAIGK